MWCSQTEMLGIITLYSTLTAICLGVHTKDSCIKMPVAGAFDTMRRVAIQFNSFESRQDEDHEKKVWTFLWLMFLNTHAFLPILGELGKEIDVSEYMDVLKALPCDVCVTTDWKLRKDKVEYNSRLCMSKQQYCIAMNRNNRDYLHQKDLVTFKYDPEYPQAECDELNAKLEHCNALEEPEKLAVGDAAEFIKNDFDQNTPQDFVQVIKAEFATLFRILAVTMGGFKAGMSDKMKNEWPTTVFEGPEWPKLYKVMEAINAVEEFLPCDACSRMSMSYSTAETLIVNKCLSEIDFCIFSLIAQVTIPGEQKTLGQQGGYSITDVSKTPNATLCGEFTRRKRSSDKEGQAKAAQNKKIMQDADLAEENRQVQARLEKEHKEYKKKMNGGDINATTGVTMIFFMITVGLL